MSAYFVNSPLVTLWLNSFICSCQESVAQMRRSFLISVVKFWALQSLWFIFFNYFCKRQNKENKKNHLFFFHKVDKCGSFYFHWLTLSVVQSQDEVKEVGLAEVGGRLLLEVRPSKTHSAADTSKIHKNQINQQPATKTGVKINATNRNKKNNNKHARCFSCLYPSAHLN